MSVSFSLNPQNKSISTYEELVLDNTTIVSDVLNKHQFSYGFVDRKDFYNQYSNKGWVYLKLWCLPKALWAAVAKTAYHLIKATFFCITQSPTFEIYKALRSLQEGYGWLATFASTSYGQYHVQEAQVQKEFYHYHANRPLFVKTLVDQMKTLEKYEFALFRKDEIVQALSAKKLTGAQLLKLASNDQLKAIGLEALTQKYGIDLKKFSRKQLALFSEDELSQALPQEMKDARSFWKETSPLTLQQMGLMKLEREKIEALNDNVLNRDPEVRGSFAMFKSSEVQAAIEQGLIKNIHILTETHIKEIYGTNEKLLSGLLNKEGLKLADLPQPLVDLLIEKKQDLKSFGIDDINYAIKNDYVPSIKDLTDNQIAGLDLAQFTDSQIRQLFLDDEEGAAKLHLIPSAQINLALRKTYWAKELLALCTDQQLKALKISTLTKVQWDHIFGGRITKEIKDIFAEFSNDEVFAAFKAGLIDFDQIELVSDAQLKMFDFSRVDKKIKKPFYKRVTPEDLKKEFKDLDEGAITKLHEEICGKLQSFIDRLSQKQFSQL